MVAGARFCHAVIGRALETAHRQVADWRRRDGVPSRDFERRTPKNLDYFAGRPRSGWANRSRYPGCPAGVTVNTEPLPRSLATVTSPPIMRASLREVASLRHARCRNGHD